MTEQKKDSLTNEIFKNVASIIGPIHLVGGSVRDVILGVEPTDFDFCTPLLPDEIEEKVRAAGRRPYLIGKRFGTIGFKLSGKFIEVTTYRQERYEKNSRKPQVDFVSDLESDLARRDFTINAIAMGQWEENTILVDPFDGQKDINAKVIRSVGKPLDRINEDPLRMLRAARFASQLDFGLNNDLADTISKKAKSIYTVSVERWVAEIDKLLTGKNPAKGLEIMADTELLRYILPELWLQVGFDQDSPYHKFTLWSHTKKAVNLAPADAEIRWAALLHDVGKPYAQKKNKKGYSNYIMHERIGAEITKGIAARLKWSKARTAKVIELISRHMEENSTLREADDRAKQ
jgi:putative nucleotidyltransferase with HDIG domain